MYYVYISHRSDETIYYAICNASGSPADVFTQAVDLLKDKPIQSSTLKHNALGEYFSINDAGKQFVHIFSATLKQALNNKFNFQSSSIAIHRPTDHQVV